MSSSSRLASAAISALDLSRLLRLAESGRILISRQGKLAGVLIGFERENDRFDYSANPRGGAGGLPGL